MRSRVVQKHYTRCTRCSVSLYVHTVCQFAGIPSTDHIINTKSGKLALSMRRRFDLNDPEQRSRQSVATPTYSHSTIGAEDHATHNQEDNDEDDDTHETVDMMVLPFEIQEKINKYKVDQHESHDTAQKTDKNETKSDKSRNKAIVAAEASTTKTKKLHNTVLVTERLSIQGSTGRLLQHSRVLSHIYATLATKCGPFRLSVSKPHTYSVSISATSKSHIHQIRQYILKHVQSKILRIECGEKKIAVIGAAGINLRMVKTECDVLHIWEDDLIPGVMYVYDKNMRNAFKAMHGIQSMLERTSILSLPIGQYGLLVVDNAYWLDFIREHSHAFIVGLDMKPSQLQQRKLQQIEDLNRMDAYADADSGKHAGAANIELVKDIIDRTMKSRLLIYGDSLSVTTNATQMIYDFLTDSQEIEIEKSEFAHVLGKRKRSISAMINEVEMRYIDDGQYAQHFESEQIADNLKDDPHWLEGLRLTVFPVDEMYGNCSLWLHGPPFMRNALRYYINSVLSKRRKFFFSNARNFWMKLVFERETECPVICKQIRTLFGAKMKLVRSQKHVKLDEDDAQYTRLYDGETYICAEVISRESKLNVDGLRAYLDDLVGNSTKMTLGNYSHLFVGNDAMELWRTMAMECQVDIVLDGDEILMIGTKQNVHEFQTRLLTAIKSMSTQQKVNVFN